MLSKSGYKVGMLLDKKATGKSMRAAIREVIGKAREGDSVVIQYSGHGSFVPDDDGDESDNTDECLCPYDLQANGYITDDELFDLYSDRHPGVRVLMISDSCHSGSIAKFAPIVTPPTARGGHAPQRIVRFLPPQVFLATSEYNKLGQRRALRRASPPGRYGALLMSGCQDTEYSYDAWFQGRPNGAFTFVALKALKTLKKGSSYSDWYKAIKKILPSQQYPQSPNLFGSMSMKRWSVFGTAMDGAKRVDSGSGGRPDSGGPRPKKRASRRISSAVPKAARSTRGKGRGGRRPDSGGGHPDSGRARRRKPRRPNSGGSHPDS